MKTSNKILLTLFVSVVLILTALHVGLYARYKGGYIVTESSDMSERFKQYDLSNIQYISITGLEFCTIIPADTAKVEAWSEQDSRLLLRVVKDTLFVYGDSLMQSQAYRDGRRTYQQVNLHLPEMKQINGSFCQLLVRGSGDSTQAPNYTIYLTEASLRTPEIHGDRPVQQYYKTFNIRAGKSSRVEFDPHVSIGNLDIALEDAMMDDHEATIDSLLLTVDDKSRVILHGTNLKKINLTPR
jgi:hypothetical protein